MAMVKASADTVNYDLDMDKISDLIDSLCDMSKIVNRYLQYGAISTLEGHDMNMGEILGWSGGTLLLLMTFVQVAPIKVNPWSGLAKKIGRAINGEVLNEIADIKKEQRETQDKLEKHIQDDDERDASMHRQRILRFNIELMRGEDFTLECFNDMLLDIDEYERFCETHPGYKNNRAVMAIANIKRVYQDHEENGGFLV